MKSTLRKINSKLLYLGFNGMKFLNNINPKNLVWFYKDLRKLKKQKGTDDTFRFGRMHPILVEKNKEGGTMKGHYFHQDLYVAQLIYMSNPKRHIDIASRTDGFVAHVASFREIELIDIREIKTKIKNIIFRKADLIKLPTDLINSCDSISSLHAIEHFGLGRYGDPIDYFGHLKALNNITQILKKNGNFYFSVPIGSQRIEFNAHRVLSLKYLINILSQKFIIHSFSYVDDKGDFYEDVKLSEKNIDSNFGCNFGCGIFNLIKK